MQTAIVGNFNVLVARHHNNITIAVHRADLQVFVDKSDTLVKRGDAVDVECRKLSTFLRKQSSLFGEVLHSESKCTNGLDVAIDDLQYGVVVEVDNSILIFGAVLFTYDGT